MTLLTVCLKPSRQLTLILSLVHLVAASLLWPLVLPLVIKLTGIVLLVASLTYYLRKDAFLSFSHSVVSFELSDEMRCTLTTRSGELMNCWIQNSTFVAPYLTVLNLKPEGKFFVRSVVILSDSLVAEEFRRLRILLRWKWKSAKKF